MTICRQIVPDLLPRAWPRLRSRLILIAMTPPARAHIRLAELLGVLSFGADLGMGQPMEHVLRQCLIASRLAERLGLDQEERAVVYYTALLVNIGCHSDAHEQAKWFGDDIALKGALMEGAGPGWAVTHFASGLDDHRFPAFADDFRAQAESADRLRALRDAGAVVRPGHDPEVLVPGPVTL